jgi:hypothetical protein
MTAFEASELFLLYLNTYFQFMLGYVGILSGFLVMSYAAADKLNTVLSILVVALFSLVSLMLLIQINFLRNDFEGLNRYLYDIQAIDPASMVWFGSNPLWVVSILTLITNTVLFGGFVGCIGYFLYQRNEKSSDGRT